MTDKPVNNDHLGTCGLCGHDWQAERRRLIDLARLVADMRHAQREYFRLRSPGVLQQAKQLERKVDAACKEILAGDQQRRLWR